MIEATDTNIYSTRVVLQFDDVVMYYSFSSRKNYQLK